MRLVGGAKGYEGRLEVHYRGQWGTVCDDGWTQTNTQVVCRQLGFRYGLHTYNIKLFDLIAGVLIIGCFVNAVVLMQVRRECVTRAVWDGGRSYSSGLCQVHRKRAQRHTLHPEGLAQT